MIARDIQVTGKIQNSIMHYVREVILWANRVTWNFVRCRQKLLHIGELSAVKLLSLIKTQLDYKFYTCFDASYM